MKKPDYLDLLPEIGYLGEEGFVYEPNPIPGSSTLLIVDVAKIHLQRHGTFKYFRGVKGNKKKKLPNLPERMWVGAMQECCCQTVYLVSDDIESGIFIFSP